MNKQAKSKVPVYLILAVVLILAGMLIQNKYELFAVLPNEGYVANNDCTFITNINSGSTWTISDYSNSQTKYISVDVDNDGQLESFGGKAQASSNSNNVCDSTNYAQIPYLSVKTLGDFSMKYGHAINSDDVYLIVCGGSILYKYQENYGAAANGVKQCSSGTGSGNGTGSGTGSGTGTPQTCDSNQFNIFNNCISKILVWIIVAGLILGVLLALKK